MSSVHRVSCVLFAASIYLCLVAAQQTADASSDCTVVATKPEAKTKLYNYNNCILASFASSIKIAEDKYIEIKDAVVDTSKSQCEDLNKGIKPELVLEFDNCGLLTLSLDQTADKKTFVSKIDGEYHMDKSSMAFSISSSELIATSKPNHLYKCQSEQSIPISENTLPSLLITNLTLESYRDASKTEFYMDADVCALDSSSSRMVGIVIGVILIAVIGVALFAYLTQRRSY